MATKTNSQRLAEIRKKRKEEEANTSSSANKSYSNSERLKGLRLGRTINFDTFESDLNSMGTTIQNIYNGWQTEETMNNTRSSVEAMQKRIDAYEEYRKIYGGADLSELAGNYKTILEDWDDRTTLYGGFKNADAYNTEKKRLDLSEQFKGLSYDDVQAKLKEYKTDSDEYKFLSEYTEYTDLNDFNTALENTKDKKSSYYKNLEKARNIYKLDNAFDLFKHYTEAEDFEEKSKYSEDIAGIDYSWNGIRNIEDDTYAYINNPTYTEKDLFSSWESDARSWVANQKRVYGADSKNTTTSQEKKGYDKLKKEEIAVYNYIYATEGKEKAQEFLDSMETTLTKRVYDEQTKNLEKAIDDSNVSAALLSALSVPMKTQGAFTGTVEAIGDVIQGKEYNPYGYYKTPTNFSFDTREYVSENITEATEGIELFGENIPSFLYNTGMSMADSAYGVATAGKANSVLMGTSAFQQKAKEMIEAGEDESTVYATALASGAAEMIFEAIGIEKLFNIKNVDSIGSIVKNALKQSGTEGLEELGTEFTNIFTDSVLRGENSEIYQTYQDLIKRGYTTKEANTEIAKQIGNQLGWAGIGGALSGFAMGGGAATKSYIESSSMGKDIRSKGQANDLLDIAQMTPRESDAYNLYTEYALRNNRENITNAQIGSLYSTLDTDARSTLSSKKSTLEQKRAATETLKKLSDVNEAKTVDKDTLKQIDRSIGIKEEYRSNVDLLISEGLESGKETKSYKLAETLKNKLDNGEEITDKEIENLVKENTKAIHNEEVNNFISTLSNEDADLFRSMYDGKSDIDALSNSFNLVSEYAENNYSADYILEHKGVLSAKQAAAIYKSKVLNSDASLEKAITNLKEKHSGTAFIEGTFNDSVINYDNTSVEGKVNWNSLGTSQKRAIVVLGQVGKGIGLDVELISDGMERGINGAFAIQGNKILIDIYAGMDKIEGSKLSDTIIPTTSHEMTHWMKSKSPELYRKLDSYVFETFKMAGETEESILAKRRKKMEASHPNETFTDAEVRDEVIARANEDMFAKSEEIKKFLNTLNDTEKKSFVGKVKEVLHNLKDWLDSFLSKQKSTSEEAAIIRKFQDRIDGQIKLWDEMLISSIEANQALKKEGITGEELAKKVTNKATNSNVQEMARNTNIDKFGYNADNISRANKQGELINEFYNALNKSEWRVFYGEIVRQGYIADTRIGTIAPIVVGDKLVIAERKYTAKDKHDYIVIDAYKLSSQDGDNYTLSLLQDAINKGDIDYDTQRIFSFIDRINRSYGTNELLTAYNRSNSRYDITLNNIKQGKSGSEIHRDSQDEITRDGLSLGDKPSVQENDELLKKSDRDTLGNTLTETQQSYFAESKVRDENGNLKVMYHGTPNAGFTVFRDGTYFTEHKWYADKYQNQSASSLSYKKTADNPDTYSVYLNIKKPFDTRNPEEARIFNEEYFGHWGMGTPLMESGLPDWLDGRDLQEFLEENGYDYDGLILDEGSVGGYGDEVISRGISYVVFSPEQVKSVDNKTPTDNPDYRFSMRENVEETKDLVAVHNLSAEKMLKTLQLGGLPMPSIAIIRAREGFNQFGDISVVFDKNTIDPALLRSNAVYGSDAWTPTFPHIDYKVNEKAQKSVEKKIKDLVPQEVRTALGGLHIDETNMENDLNRFDGDLTKAYRNSYPLKYAYAIDKGIELNLPTNVADLDGFGIFKNDAIIFVANELGKDNVEKYDDLSSKEKTDLAPMLIEKFNKFMEEKTKLKGISFYNSDNFGFAKVDAFLYAAKTYFNKGLTPTVDYRESVAILNEVIDQKDFENWIREEFSEVIEKKGLRNNKDLFTPSGNRRNFEALHYEVTLENIVKAMAEQGIQGIGGWGNGNIIGGSATKFNSIDEIKNEAETRLQTVPQAEYENIRKALTDRFWEISNSLNANSFSAASDLLVEAVVKYKTKSGIANYLKKESKGWANYSDHIVDDLMELVNDIRKMPVDYFEAKPQRAVGYNEIKAVIMPEQSSYEDDLSEIKSELEKYNIPIIEYTYGDNQERIKALNSLEDVKFSDRDTAYMEAVNNRDADTLEKMVAEAAEKAMPNSKVRDDNGNLRLVYHGRVSEFNVFDRSFSNIEGDFGKGYYFTSNEYDVDANYANEEGADLTNKIARYAEQLEYEDEYADLSYEERKEIAREKFITSEPNTITAYLDMENPVYITPNEQGTFLDFNEEYDEEYDEYGEPEGLLVDFIEALNNNAAEYSSWKDVDFSFLYEEAYVGGLYAADAVQKIKNRIIDELTDENGDLAVSEVIRLAFEDIGFDGIIDTSVYYKFRNMNGMDSGTTHYIVFNSNQIKEADLVTYDDNGNVIPLSERFNTANEDIRYSDRDSEGTQLTENQIEFFKESKLRDENGNLLVVYHGTNKKFTIFNQGEKTGWIGKGIYFAADKKYARENGKKVISAYLNVKNPFVTKTNSPSSVLSEIQAIYPQADLFNMADILKNEGYDGIIFTHWDKGKIISVFSPEQIKETSNKNPTLNPDIRFSDRDNVSVYDKMGEIDKLIKENEHLKNDVERLKERLKLERQVTNGNYFNEKQLDAVAGHIRNLANSNYSKKDLVSLLNGIYSYISHSPNLNWQDMFAQCYDVAKMVIDEAKPITVTNDYYKQILREIRSKRISLSETQIHEAKNAFGARYQNSLIGKFTVAKDGISLDSQWQEWASTYPEFFDAEVTEGNQITELYDIYDNLREASETVVEYDIEERTRWLATEIYNQFWNVSPIRTTADKYNKEIKLLNFEHRRTMKELRDSFDERLKNQHKADMEHSKEMQDKIRENRDAKLDEQRFVDDVYYGRKILEIKKSMNEKLSEQHKADRQKAIELYQKIRDIKNAEIAVAKEAGKQKLSEYKERAEQKTLIQRITANALDLNKLLMKNSKDKHIHEAMKPVVVNLLQAIDFSSKRMIDKNIPTQKDISLADALSKVKDMMLCNTVNKEDIIELYGAGLDEEIIKLVDNVNATMRVVGDNEYVLNRMSLADLKTLDKIVKIIKQAVNKMNKFHTIKHAQGIANLAQEEIIYADSLGKTKVFDPQRLRAKMNKLTKWDNITPYYAFNKFGEAGKKVFEAFQDGWDKFAFNIKSIMDYANDTYTSKEVKAWEKDIKTFKILLPSSEVQASDPNYRPQYQEVKLSVAQIMSLYCLQKREQAKGHLFGGGIRVSDITLKKGEIVTQEDGAIITQSDLTKIINTLTERQLEVADKLQRFLNTTCADWGNAISMARFGYKAFGEENYFPIESDKNNLATDDESVQDNSLFRLLNMSFAKATINKANNRIVIKSIFDVFAQHTSDMAKYNALALPVLDTFRWYNYTEKAKQGDDTFITKSVKTSIEKAFGKEGKNYITTFLKDINGQQNVGRDTLGKKFFTNAKIASVALNLRVVFLQPTSYLRASAVIDNKYLLNAFLHKPKIKKAEEHCGMALWKSMGYYDTDVTKGVAEQIKHSEKLKDKLTDISLKGAEWADKFTFGYLWNACELEVRKKRKDLKVGSDEFYDAISKRLREVIYATQVVDSTMTRSQIMRSGNMYEKMLTSFSSEPTLAYNMVVDCWTEMELEARKTGSKKAALKKHGKKTMKVLFAYTVTNALAALVESGFDAFREEDDEEMDLEQFMKYYLHNFLTDMSLTAKIPYIKEFVSIAQGFSSSRTDTQWMQSFSYAVKGLFKAMQGEGNPYSAFKNLLRGMSYVSGLPFFSSYRDLMASLDKLDILTTEDIEEMFEDFFGI